MNEEKGFTKYEVALMAILCGLGAFFGAMYWWVVQ
jgi:hypothetical protein